jgi:hypothetical protein
MGTRWSMRNHVVQFRGFSVILLQFSLEFIVSCLASCENHAGWLCTRRNHHQSRESIGPFLTASLCWYGMPNSLKTSQVTFHPVFVQKSQCVSMCSITKGIWSVEVDSNCRSKIISHSSCWMDWISALNNRAFVSDI